MSTALKAQSPSFDPLHVRAAFPLLGRSINGQPLAYLDNAASSQRPLQVIEALDDYQRRHHSNVHRGVHALSQEATSLFESSRERLMRFINAASTREIIFVRGTTEGINLVAQAHARPVLQAGDEVLITGLEHHANIVPWQLACAQTGAKLVVAPIDERGEVTVSSVVSRFGPRTRILACAHASNALGTVLPVRELVAAARARGIVTVVDGAQAIPHLELDVRDLGCDFYAFSGHKMFGPTGIGVLYGREELLQAMPPWQGGGDMILTVSFEKTTYNALPHKFEAGTPNIEGAIGLGAAVDYLGSLDRAAAAAHESALRAHAERELGRIPGLRIIGTSGHKLSLTSFVLEGVHPHDLGTILDERGVAIRTGHHCAMPVMDFFDLPATARASFAFYNTFDEVDRLVAGVDEARRLFA